jgi:putative membrane protein
LAGALIRLVITAIAVVVAAYVLPDQYLRVDGLESILIFALILGVLNALVRPVLLLLTLPLNLLTLGLFTLVVNAIVFWLATLFLTGVEVGGFVGAFLAALVVSVISFVLSRLVP